MPHGWSVILTAAAQHRSIKHTERLADAGIEPSVGNIGICC